MINALLALYPSKRRTRTTRSARRLCSRGTSSTCEFRFSRELPLSSPLHSMALAASLTPRACSRRVQRRRRGNHQQEILQKWFWPQRHRDLLARAFLELLLRELLGIAAHQHAEETERYASGNIRVLLAIELDAGELWTFCFWSHFSEANNNAKYLREKAVWLKVVFGESAT